MPQFRNFLLLTFAILVALLAWHSPLNGAAPFAKNLLRGHNPSFEQGIDQWLWSNDVAPNFVIGKGHQVHTCGSKVLRIKKSSISPQLDSPRVPILEAGTYRFSVWLKANRRANQDASIEGLAVLLQSGNTRHSYTMNLNKDYLTRWTRQSIDIEIDTPWQSAGFFFLWKNYYGGKLLIDCAHIAKIA